MHYERDSYVPTSETLSVERANSAEELFLRGVFCASSGDGGIFIVGTDCRESTDKIYFLRGAVCR